MQGHGKTYHGCQWKSYGIQMLALWICCKSILLYLDTYTVELSLSVCASMFPFQLIIASRPSSVVLQETHATLIPWLQNKCSLIWGKFIFRFVFIAQIVGTNWDKCSVIWGKLIKRFGFSADCEISLAWTLKKETGGFVLRSHTA